MQIHNERAPVLPNDAAPRIPSPYSLAQTDTRQDTPRAARAPLAPGYPAGRSLWCTSAAATAAAQAPDGGSCGRPAHRQNRKRRDSDAQSARCAPGAHNTPSADLLRYQRTWCLRRHRGGGISGCSASSRAFCHKSGCFITLICNAFPGLLAFCAVCAAQDAIHDGGVPAGLSIVPPVKLASYPLNRAPVLTHNAAVVVPEWTQADHGVFYEFMIIGGDVVFAGAGSQILEAAIHAPDANVVLGIGVLPSDLRSLLRASPVKLDFMRGAAVFVTVALDILSDEASLSRRKSDGTLLEYKELVVDDARLLVDQLGKKVRAQNVGVEVHWVRTAQECDLKCTL